MLTLIAKMKLGLDSPSRLYQYILNLLSLHLAKGAGIYNMVKRIELGTTLTTLILIPAKSVSQKELEI